MIYIGYLIAAIISIVLSWNWIKLTNDKFIHSESFRDATKLGITITTLAYPVMISSSNYFQTSKFWHIIACISISTFLGLWNNFSIATLADSDGRIKIGYKNNNLMPTFLVAQFFFMMYAVLLSLIYAEKPQIKEEQKIIISQIEFPIRNSRKDLVKYFGVPNKEFQKKDTVFYEYKMQKTKVTFKIFNDTIIERKEKLYDSDRKK